MKLPSNESEAWDELEKSKEVHQLRVLVNGIIAEGTAGRAGSGSQYIHVMRKTEALLEWIGGRRYGSPSFYISYLEGEKLIQLPYSEYALL
jgi:hypothetical protein